MKHEFKQPLINSSKHALVLVLLCSFSFGACSTTRTYGLLASRAPQYDQEGKAKIVPDNSIKIEDQGCRRFLLFFIPIWFGRSIEGLVESNVKDLKRDDVIGVANVETSRSILPLFPFYFSACFKIKGVAAISK